MHKIQYLYWDSIVLELIFLHRPQVIESHNIISIILYSKAATLQRNEANLLIVYTVHYTLWLLNIVSSPYRSTYFFVIGNVRCRVRSYMWHVHNWRWSNKWTLLILCLRKKITNHHTNWWTFEMIVTFLSPEFHLKVNFYVSNRTRLNSPKKTRLNSPNWHDLKSICG